MKCPQKVRHFWGHSKISWMSNENFETLFIFYCGFLPLASE